MVANDSPPARGTSRQTSSGSFQFISRFTMRKKFGSLALRGTKTWPEGRGLAGGGLAAQSCWAGKRGRPQPGAQRRPWATQLADFSWPHRHPLSS